MDFIFYSLGTAGDSLPFIKLCSALNLIGRKSVYLCNERFLPLAKQYGVEAYSVSSQEDYDRTYRNPLTWSSLYNQNHYNEFHLLAAKFSYKAIEKYVRRGFKPVVVFQDVNSGARMACIEFGLKYCQIVLAPSLIHSCLDPAYPIRKHVPEQLWSEKLPNLRDSSKKATFERLVTPLINPMRRELGLPEWKLDDIPQLEDSTSILALFPHWFKSPPADWPTQVTNTGFVLSDSIDGGTSETLENFLKSNGKPVVFSFGTGVPTNRFLIDKLKKICRVINKPGIFVGAPNDEIVIEKNHPPFFISRAVCFSTLFPEAALVVHHGGIGTCAQALSAGIPQLISPYTFDQPDNAYCIWKLGVGNSIDILLAPIDEIAICINDLLSDKHVEDKCAKYARKTIDALDASVAYLLSLVTEEKSRP